jgi:LPXTG-motif cell wall-anchored protein
MMKKRRGGKIMKLIRNSRFVLIALVLSLLFVLFFAQAAFAQDIRLSASEETGKVGDTVTVKVSISNALDTEGGQFDLSFGPTMPGESLMLEPQSITGGAFVPNFSSDNYNLNAGPNKLRVLWVTAAGSSQDSGVICNIVFKITAAGETQLNFSDVLIVDPRDGRNLATPTSGKVIGQTGPVPPPDPDPDPDNDLEAKIKAANDAINKIPEVGKLNCNDWATVQDARRLVELALSHGAKNSDFINLSKLVAAEEWINKNCQVTPRTGGAYFYLMIGILLLAVGTVILRKRKQFAIK